MASTLNNNEPNQELNTLNNRPDQNYNTRTDNTLYSTQLYHPKNYSHYHTFLNTTCPVGKSLDHKRYAGYYNKKMLKDSHPLYTRNELPKYLKNDGSLIKSNKRYYSCDKKNFDSTPYRTQENCRFRGVSQENPTINQCEFPSIRPTYNDRYENCRGIRMRVFDPKIRQRVADKVFSRSTLNNYENFPNNRTSSTGFYKNFSCEKCKDPNFETIKSNARRIPKRDLIFHQFKNQFNYTNYALRMRGKRTFLKAQIFNNYKPFLVDNFMDFAEYS